MGAHADLEAGVRRLHAESGGLIEVTVVTAAQALALTAEALTGDRRAALKLQALDRFMQRLDAARGSADAQLCLTCDQLLSGGHIAVVLILPRRDNPTRALVLGLCERCFAAHPDLAAVEAAVQQALQRMLWPDLRPIAALAGEGHA
jgi:hypothetical protein